jgi:hypothetical protein
MNSNIDDKDFKLNILINEISSNLIEIKNIFDDKFKDNYYSTDDLIDQIEDFFTNYCYLSMNVYNFIGLIITELKNENFDEILLEENNSSKDN